MRYLVRARIKPGREADLLKAIDSETLGHGSVAEGEYLRNMQEARLSQDATARWVEVCYCPLRCRKSVRTGTNISISHAYRTRMIVANAAITMELSLGPAADATAQHGWKTS